jgi:dihydrofolate reductase
VIRSLIVARARNGIIGRDNALPWHLPSDLAHFKKTTMGCPIVMGRRTWQSIGRPLPGRRNIVVTRDERFAAPGAEVVHTLAEAWRITEQSPEVFVIGGAGLYEAALPFADRIYLTEVESDVPGDISFPAIDPRDWLQTPLASQPADERHPYALRFLRLDRRNAPGSR